MGANYENTFLDSKESLAELADKLHVTPNALVKEIISQRRTIAMNAELPKRQLDYDNVEQVNRNSDKLAEKFVTVRSDYEGHSNEWATVLRDAMRNDKAAIAARKIIRAIPVELDTVVTTKLGHEIVTINKVETVPNPERIQAKLEFAKTRADRARAKLAEAIAQAESKTVLNRVPKELQERVDSRAAVLDKYNSRVTQLTKELADASKGHSAAGLRYSRIADVRLSLRPQSMANRVAVIARSLPTRNDVHPFRELPTIHAVTATSFVGGIESPDGAYLRYERHLEHMAELARLMEIDRATRAAEIQKMVDEYDARNEAQFREQRIAENKAKRALAARTRRRNSKIRNSR